MASNYLVVKIGGRPAANQAVLDQLLLDLKASLTVGLCPVLVHGGGADVTELSRRLGIEPVFVNGKRQTSLDEMAIVDAVLGGQVNSRLLRRALVLGLPAVGLSGIDDGLFTGATADGSATNRTGTIAATNPRVVQVLAAEGLVPIISSLSTDQAGQGLNINADDAAMELAKTLKARALVFLSDIPGVLKNSQVLSTLTPNLAESEIASGVISGGMIPKIRGAVAALEAGIGSVIIGDFEAAGDLQKMLSGGRGTQISQGR